MNTKCFYQDGLWEAIANHPNYTLGLRERSALQEFLPVVAREAIGTLDVLHLGVATGQEIPYLVQALPQIQHYLLNDICGEVLQKTLVNAQRNYSDIGFFAHKADVELAGAVSEMRTLLPNRTLLLLVGNAVIFSNREMGKFIRKAMKQGDLFLLTVESPHEHMADSYLIPPVFSLLSQSGLAVRPDNIHTSYDKASQTFQMSSGGKILLPTSQHLQDRMTNSGFTEVAVAAYPDLQMLAGLYKKGR